VLVVTGVKEALEDYYRYKADKRNNREQFKILRPEVGEIVISSQDIKAGDIVHVEEGQKFPADLVVLVSSNGDGTCYLQTANLDGETNLKLRKALPATASTSSSIEKLLNIKGTIQCESPNERLYQFNGRLVLQNESGPKTVYGLDHTQLLQRVSKNINSVKIVHACGCRELS
jgi:phospholipid-transporting ATPase